MTTQQYEPGIYVVRLNGAAAVAVHSQRTDTWYVAYLPDHAGFAAGGDWRPHGEDDILAGPIPIGRIRAANEMYGACSQNRKYLFTLQHWFERYQTELKSEGNPEGHGVCHVLASIKTLADQNEAALQKADKAE